MQLSLSLWKLCDVDRRFCKRHESLSTTLSVKTGCEGWNARRFKAAQIHKTIVTPFSFCTGHWLTVCIVLRVSVFRFLIGAVYAQVGRAGRSDIANLIDLPVGIVLCAVKHSSAHYADHLFSRNHNGGLLYFLTCSKTAMKRPPSAHGASLSSKHDSAIRSRLSFAEITRKSLRIVWIPKLSLCAGLSIACGIHCLQAKAPRRPGWA